MSKVEELLASDLNALQIVRHSLIAQRPLLEEISDPRSADFIPTMTDQRNTVLRSIKERRGQAKFRNALIKRYGPRCLVTDCAILDIVEAAHIAPYRGEEYNNPSNGLLLRADIHTLFDLNLMWIKPSSYQIIFHPDALEGEYINFHGRKIVFSRHTPSGLCLEMRWRSHDMIG